MKEGSVRNFKSRRVIRTFESNGRRSGGGTLNIQKIS
jgi:hypothetical protein